VTLVLSAMCLERAAKRHVLTAATLCRAAQRVGGLAERLFVSVGRVDLEEPHVDRLAATTGGSVGCHFTSVKTLVLTDARLCTSVGRCVLYVGSTFIPGGKTFTSSLSSPPLSPT
jgi:hypothetical protein